MLSDSFKCAFVSTNQRPTSPGEYLMCRFIVGGVMGAEIAEPARRPVLTCRGGNPAMANTEASEVRSGMFAPPQCPADWLMVGRGGLGVGGMKILRGQGLTAYMWNTRLRGRASRSWETSQLDFEPWRQNFEANTGGKLPPLSALSDSTANVWADRPSLLKTSASCVRGCVSTLSVWVVALLTLKCVCQNNWNKTEL